MEQLLGVLLHMVAAASQAASCQLGVPPEVIASSTHELHQSWTLAADPVLQSPALPADAGLIAFRQEVANRIGDVRPESILKLLHQRFAASADPNYSRESENPRLAYTGEAGTLRPVSCLEALLLDVQIRRLPMIEQPTEFAAFILENPSLRQIRVYFSTQDRMGLRGVHEEVRARLSKDLSMGWTLSAHLHNHPFDFSNPVATLGGPAPSLSDVDAYREQNKELPLLSARVTNGFSTIEISRAEFQRFHGHEEH